MKKLITLVFAVSFLFGCSSSDDNQDSNSYSFSFNLDGYHKYKNSNNLQTTWNYTQLSNGRYSYTIQALTLDREGAESPDDTIFPFSFSFEVLNPIEVGQIISINNIDLSPCSFPTNNAPLGALPFDCCNLVDNAYYMRPELTSSTTGQIKITAINGDKISGTFFFNNLSNFFYGQYPFGSGNWYQNSCLGGTITAPVAPTTISISNGSFNNITLE